MVHAFANSTLSTVDVQPALVLRTILGQVSDFIADETLCKRKVRVWLWTIPQRVLAAAAIVTNLLPSAVVRIAAVVVATVSQRVSGSSASETDQLVLEYAPIRRRRLSQISFVLISTARAESAGTALPPVSTSAVLFSFFLRARRHRGWIGFARLVFFFSTQRERETREMRIAWGNFDAMKKKKQTSHATKK